MISGIIVGVSLVLAGIFVLVWLARPAFRRAVEMPKHEFQDQLARYDQQCLTESAPTPIVGEESDSQP